MTMNVVARRTYESKNAKNAVNTDRVKPCVYLLSPTRSCPCLCVFPPSILNRILFNAISSKKKSSKKGHTKAPYAVYGEKKRCTSCSTRAHKCPQMLYLALERIASKYPQTTAEPSALFLSFRLQSALRAGIRILKNRVFREGMKFVYKGC